MRLMMLLSNCENLKVHEFNQYNILLLIVYENLLIKI